MLWTELEYHCSELKCFLECWNTFDRVGIPVYTAGISMYRVVIPSRVLECFRHCWHAFDRVGIPLYRVGMLSTGLECLRQCWYTFVKS
jgi:hypothetical protein